MSVVRDSGLAGADPSILTFLRSLGIENDPAFGHQFLGVYLTQSRAQLDAIRQALAEGKSDAVLFAAHKLKGSASTVGALRLALLCDRAESAARSGNLDDVRSAIPELEAAFSAAAAQIERFVQSLPPPTS